MTMQTKQGVLLCVLVVSMLFLMSGAYALVSSQIERGDGTPINTFDFDWRTQYLNTTTNNSFGSDSYMDLSPTNPDVFLHVCHPNLSEGQFLDVVYATRDERILSSILQQKAYISYTNTYADAEGLYNCTRVNVDFSSDYAVYPGFLRAVLIHTNATDVNYNAYTNTSDYTLFSPMNLFFAGEYQMGVNVIGPPKQYLFTTVNVYDAFGHLNTRHEPKLLTSIMSPNNTVYESARLSPRESLSFGGDIVGGETVIINDLLALELKQYNPCDPINASGYYMMNSSKFNHNESCIVIKDMENVVINFGGEQIDGDGLENGSLTEDLCSVTIENSKDITLENLRVYEYYYGICIKNSSVTLYGDGAKFNEFGAIVFGESTATLVDISFDNIQSEIIAVDNSTVHLVQLNFSSAFVKSTFTNALARSVRTIPPLLNVTDMMHIDQFLQFEPTGPWASAQVSFYYEEPMPNGVVTNNLSIYKFNGSYNLENVTRVNTTTNISYIEEVQRWSGGDWEKLFTIIRTWRWR